MPYVVAGIVMANIAIELGIFYRVLPVLKPFIKLSKLSSGSCIAIATAFGSPQAAISMIAEIYRNRKISRTEAYITSIATWFPQTVYESIAYIAPAIIPLLGPLGITYICLFILNGAIVAGIALLAGRLLLKDNDEVEISIPSRNIREAIYNGFKRSKRTLKRYVAIALPITIVAFVLLDVGLINFDLPLPLPPEALAIIPLRIANPLAAYAALSEIMDTITFKQALIVLLVASPIGSLRYIFAHRLPYYVGLFGVDLGTKIVLVGGVIRICATFGIIIAVWFLF
ncbi:Uncharacterized protein conserved in archaea [Archaeoglobus sulfaticallidus PM70-1]|uniref:Uncharacterized protein conserved in archaea n=1 Tax=Archaeoglobus sulfaticallidus PM70-1 TaxID=387631 RepID=N0BKA5_9EURY|nr:hypothetical protein [Archaeoglobus sulfaticallidus]AGK60931.1 Uncharacterized protein conserved in archaea [Archaeoglobus sulfaticallidus PM70-1]